MAAQFGPQPDFAAIAASHRSLADEMEKVPNTPQFAQGNALLDEFRAMERRMIARFDRVENIFELRKPFITNHYLYSDDNSAARISNSYLLNATDALTPLTRPTDNTPIAGFPNTSGDIGNMTDAELNTLLGELGLGVAGQRPAREQRLRQYIGLRQNPRTTA
jgi:hypothetical protein